MSSVYATAGKPFLICFAKLLLFLLFLSSSDVRAASLREHRLRGSESDSRGENAPQAPNADMLKALQYIESLRQRSGSVFRPQSSLSAGYETSHGGDAEKLQAMMRLAPNPMKMEYDEEGEEEGGNDEREDKSEELLQAVLSTLQQTEKSAKPASLSPSVEGAASEDGAYARVQQRQRGIAPHKKLPLMFEDEEEGEGDEDEEDEGPAKRTNENVEEKYTPQNMATLQSMFDELDKMTKPMQKRQEEEGDVEEEDDEDEDDGTFNVRNVAYDNVGRDFTDWGPLQEKEEDEEEEKRDGIHEVDRGFDYNEDDDEKATDADEEEDDEGYPVKISKDADDVANLVDYYLLKVLEKTEEEQKRAIKEEEEQEEDRSERRAPQAQYRGLLDMFESARENNNYHTSLMTRPGSRFYNEHLPRERPLKDMWRGRFFNFQGFGVQESPSRNRKPNPGSQYRGPLSRPHTQPSEPSSLGLLRETIHKQSLRPSKQIFFPSTWYGNTAYHNLLKGSLAPKAQAQYPMLMYGNNKAGKKRDAAGQGTAGSFEQAIQDYFDQMDSDKSLNEKRQTEDEKGGSDTQTQGFDNEAVMKLLSYLNPETESDAQAAQ